MENDGHLDLDPAIKAKLLQMSAATIDRALRTVREASPKARRRGVAATALRRSVPVLRGDNYDGRLSGNYDGR